MRSCCPTFYTGTHIRNEPLFGAGRAIDPARHFVVSINLFGNGYSSSPSNTPPPQDGPRFPHVTLFDNVACQHRLLTERLGVKRIALVLGWSMAAMQAYQWAAQYPEWSRRSCPIAARPAALPSITPSSMAPRRRSRRIAPGTAATTQRRRRQGLRAFGRVYVAWAYSHAFFAKRLYRELGFSTLEDFMRDWEGDHLNWDANDLLAKIWTWQHGDISDNAIYGGDFTRALQSITARAILMPCSTDMYFVPADNAAEFRNMRRAELRVFESPVGPLRGLARDACVSSSAHSMKPPPNC